MVVDKEGKKKYMKQYRLTEQSIKSQKIGSWKHYGVICDDFDKLYNYYINCWNCEKCGIELINGRHGANKKTLDHNHKTGEFRNVLCNTCNTKQGHIDNNIVKLSNNEKMFKYRLKRFILS